jgi:hypothetical protein
MNERIHELAIQAAGKGFNTFATSDFDSQEKIEKFAELIVRECMDNLAWHGHDEAVSQLDWFLHHKIRG